MSNSHEAKLVEAIAKALLGYKDPWFKEHAVVAVEVVKAQRWVPVTITDEEVNAIINKAEQGAQRVISERDAALAEVERLEGLWRGEPVARRVTTRDTLLARVSQLEAEVKRLTGTDDAAMELSRRLGLEHEEVKALNKLAFDQSERANKADARVSQLEEAGRAMYRWCSGINTIDWSQAKVAAEEWDAALADTQGPG